VTRSAFLHSADARDDQTCVDRCSSRGKNGLRRSASANIGVVQIVMFIHVDPNSRLAKIILVVGILLWVILLWVEMDELELSNHSRSWPVANGTIRRSEVEKQTDVHGIPHWTAKIEYAYVVKGQHFENDKIVFGVLRGGFTWGDAARKVATWPKGKAAAVHYDPNQPKISCLETGGFGWEDGAFILLGCLGLALGTKTAIDAAARFWTK
jgi:hypothetical protein